MFGLVIMPEHVGENVLMVQKDVEGPHGAEHGNSARDEVNGSLCPIHPYHSGPQSTLPSQ